MRAPMAPVLKLKQGTEGRKMTGSFRVAVAIGLVVVFIVVVSLYSAMFVG